MKKRFFLFLLLFLVIILSAYAVWADGKFFYEPFVEVDQPQQSGLLWLDGNRETLILRVKYYGAKGEFGWVVPTPSEPKVSTASEEIFDELAWLTRPIEPKEPIKPGAMSTDAAPSQSAQVTVVAQVQAGPYDATILAATDPKALTDWLNQHGYEMPKGAEKVLDSYVNRGWYYVATRINSERTQEELLASLQKKVLPDLKSLDDAPKAIADHIITTADKDTQAGRKLLEKLTHQLDIVSGIPSDTATASRRHQFDDMQILIRDGMLARFNSYYNAKDKLLENFLTEKDIDQYFRLIKKEANWSDDEFLKALQKADIATRLETSGKESEAMAGSFKQGMLQNVMYDLENDVLWENSSLLALAKSLRAQLPKKAAEKIELRFRQDYRARRQILALALKPESPSDLIFDYQKLSDL